MTDEEENSINCAKSRVKHPWQEMPGKREEKNVSSRIVDPCHVIRKPNPNQSWQAHV